MYMSGELLLFPRVKRKVLKNALRKRNRKLNNNRINQKGTNER